MRNTTASQPAHVVPIGNWLRYGIVVAVIAIVAALAISALDTAPAIPDAGLTRAQQAEADRLNGLAKAQATEQAENNAAVAGDEVDPHQSPEISRVRAGGIDPHESPEVLRVSSS